MDVDNRTSNKLLNALLNNDDLAFKLEMTQNRIVSLKQEIANPTRLKRRSNFDRKGISRVLFRTMQKQLNRGQTAEERRKESERDRNTLVSLNERVVELRGLINKRHSDIEAAARLEDSVKAELGDRLGLKNGAETPRRSWKNEIAKKAKR